MAAKTILSFFGIKKKTHDHHEDAEARQSHLSKIRPSDDDRPRWYAEPDIDKKAKDYIKKIRQQMDQSGSSEHFS